MYDAYVHGVVKHLSLFFLQRPKTSREQLEALEGHISRLSASKQRSQQYEKSFVGYLLVVSFLIYLVLALLFYLYFLPKTRLEVAVNSLPLLLFPVV